ncbi:histone deacetylase [Litorivivens sp.]|uniref:histone deacetylase family protein n=1 Tax=Litorivivens sp. TaxID=2020868 RepID=UPI0035635A04
MIPLIFDPIYSQLDLPERHRFPIDKYRTLRDLLLSLGAVPTQFLRPKALRPESLEGALCADYIGRFVSGELDRQAMRRIGFPWSEQLVKRTFAAVGGTILAGVLSLERGRAINLTGGYHHAFYDYGAGFCIVNDLYLSALNLIQNHGVERVLIVDCDVHQGDGTASLASGRDDIFTVSLHGEKNFPFRKQHSDLDVALPQGTGDDEYLGAVEAALEQALSVFRPDAVIYDAGADVHADDDLGHFELSTQGIYQRDRLVLERCALLGLPVSAVIGGGYQRDMAALSNVHLQLFRAAGVVG